MTAAGGVFRAGERRSWPATSGPRRRVESHFVQSHTHTHTHTHTSSVYKAPMLQAQNRRWYVRSSADKTRASVSFEVVIAERTTLFKDAGNRQTCLLFPYLQRGVKERLALALPGSSTPLCDANEYKHTTPYGRPAGRPAQTLVSTKSQLLLTGKPYSMCGRHSSQ